MTAKELENWILMNYQDIIVTDAYRGRSFFYNPDNPLPKGIYFTTIKESDGPNAKAGIINYDFDFTELDVLMPHPIYAWLGWVAINNPTANNTDTVKHLLDISYQNVLLKFKKKK